MFNEKKEIFFDQQYLQVTQLLFESIFDIAINFFKIEKNRKIKLYYPENIYKVLKICIDSAEIKNLIKIKKIALLETNSTNDDDLLKFWKILKDINISVEAIIDTATKLNGEFMDCTPLLCNRMQYFYNVKDEFHVDELFTWACGINHSKLAEYISKQFAVSQHTVEDCIATLKYPQQRDIIHVCLEHRELQDHTIRALLIKKTHENDLSYFKFLINHQRLSTFTWDNKMLVNVILNKNINFLQMLLKGFHILPILSIISDAIPKDFYEKLLAENPEFFSLIFSDSRLKIHVDFSIFYPLLLKREHKDLIWKVIENGCGFNLQSAPHSILKKTVPLIAFRGYGKEFFENRNLLEKEEAFDLVCKYGVVAWAKKYIIENQQDIDFICEGLQTALNSSQSEIIQLFLDDNLMTINQKLMVDLMIFMRGNQLELLDCLLNHQRIDVKKPNIATKNFSLCNPDSLALFATHQNTDVQTRNNIMKTLASQRDFFRLGCILIEQEFEPSPVLILNLFEMASLDKKKIPSAHSTYLSRAHLLTSIIADKSASEELIVKIKKHLMGTISPLRLKQLFEMYELAHLIPMEYLHADKQVGKFFSAVEEEIERNRFNNIATYSSDETADESPEQDAGAKSSLI